jgi:predicted O-methyltransferase YrrM
MGSEQWTAVDRYIDEHLIGDDPALEAALADSDAGGLPAISVTAAQGKLLYLLAKTQNAKRILEIGTLGGYSAIFMARALPPDGKLTTLEIDPHHAEVARKNVARAGLQDVVDIRVGKALDTLATLNGPFDLFFIDADKPNIPEYFQWALSLSRIGSVIVVDNVVRNGALANAQSDDANVQGVQRLHAMLSNEKRVSATTIQTVGSKGYDGFTLAVVLTPAAPIRP